MVAEAVQPVSVPANVDERLAHPQTQPGSANPIPAEINDLSRLSAVALESRPPVAGNW